MASQSCDYCGKAYNDEGEGPGDVIADAMLGSMHPACRAKFVRNMKDQKGI